MLAMDSQTASVLMDTIGKTCILTLNRPEKLNAANLEMQEQLLACIKAVAANPELRAVVLTGAGKAFSAGGDRKYLEEIAAGHLPDKAALARVHFDTIECMLSLSLPVIAAVNGPAIGYAAGLVALCDMVVMGEAAFLCDPHVHFGVAATAAAQIVWPRQTSYATAKEILLTGRRVDAQEAVRLGLANTICATGKELETALKIADGFAAMPVAGVAATKHEFNRPLLAEAAAARAAEPVLNF